MASSNLSRMKQPSIGMFIRALRQQMNLTQEQFAAEVGVVYPTVNRWENGHAHPSPMALKSIEAKLENLGEQGQELLNRYWAKSSVVS